jgi:hypothetical protein
MRVSIVQHAHFAHNSCAKRNKLRYPAVYALDAPGFVNMLVNIHPNMFARHGTNHKDRNASCKAASMEHQTSENCDC